MFVLNVRCVSTAKEIFGDVSVNHSRTGCVKLLESDVQGRASRLSSSGDLSPDYSLSPAEPQTACDQPPLHKRMTRPCASRTLLSSFSVGNRRHAVGTHGRPWAEATGPAQPFRRSQLSYPVLARATAPAIMGASRLGPNVDGSCRDKEVSFTTICVTPLAPEVTVHETPPFVAGVASRDGRPTFGVGAFRRPRDLLVSESALCSTQVRSHGACGSVPHA